jgi:hypothetical protein
MTTQPAPTATPVDEPPTALAPELLERLAQVETELEAWKAQPAAPFVRLDDAGSAALALVELARRPAVRTRLAGVESAHWDGRCIDRLERFARAGVALQASAGELQHCSVAGLMAEASERRARLLGLLVHHFKKDPAMVAAAKQIDPGTTRLGMSKALYRLHELLAPHEAFLSHDRSAYLAEDFTRALPLADALADAQVKTLIRPRAGLRSLLRTALASEYEHLRFAIAFATFDLAEVDVPESFVAFVRRRKARRKKKAPTPKRGAGKAERREETDGASAAPVREAERRPTAGAAGGARATGAAGGARATGAALGAGPASGTGAAGVGPDASAEAEAPPARRAHDAPAHGPAGLELDDEGTGTPAGAPALDRALASDGAGRPISGTPDEADDGAPSPRAAPRAGDDLGGPRPPRRDAGRGRDDQTRPDARPLDPRPGRWSAPRRWRRGCSTSPTASPTSSGRSSSTAATSRCASDARGRPARPRPSPSPARPRPGPSTTS